MSRLVKIVDNKYVQIEEYRNPNICFNTNEYDNSENYCTLRETFDPFEMFYENQELKKQLEEYKENYQEELDENSKLSELWCDSRAKIRELERQLEYLRSGEYYNQLRFENKMLQDIVDNGTS